MFTITDIRDSVPAFGEAIAVKKDGVLPRLNKAEGIYNGPPTAQDLARIEEVTGESFEADDLYVQSFLAVDNTIHLDYESFSISVLDYYARGMVGKGLILNHAWHDIGNAKGMAFEAAIYRTDSIPAEELELLPMRQRSEELVESHGGYYWVLVKAVFRVNSPVVDGLKDGSINHCSMGAKLYDGYVFCPDCSKERDRYVGFWEEESIGTGKDGEEETRYVCPHTKLSEENLWWAQWSEDSEKINWSSGVLVDGAVKAVELTLCIQGAVGTARPIRLKS